METDIMKELCRQGEVQRKYARYFDDHEDKLAPSEFPEAAEFDHISRSHLTFGET